MPMSQSPPRRHSTARRVFSFRTPGTSSVCISLAQERKMSSSSDAEPPLIIPECRPRPRKRATKIGPSSSERGCSKKGCCHREWCTFSSTRWPGSAAGGPSANATTSGLPGKASTVKHSCNASRLQYTHNGDSLFRSTAVSSCPSRRTSFPPCRDWQSK